MTDKTNAVTLKPVKVDNLQLGSTQLAFNQEVDKGFNLFEKAIDQAIADLTNHKTAIDEVSVVANQGVQNATTAQSAVDVLETRTVKISGGATASAKSLGDGNIDLAVTTLDASKLTNKIPKQSYAGTKVVGEAVVYNANTKIDFVDIAELGTAAKKNAATTGAGNVLVIGSDGLISTDVLPALALTETNVVASQEAMLALKVQAGDIAVRSDLKKTFILKASPASTLKNWVELQTPTDAVQSVNGEIGAVVLDTDKVNEGSTNLYYNEKRATANFTENLKKASSASLSDGSTLVHKADSIEAIKITQDTTHRFITDTERTSWEGTATNVTNIGATVINATGDATGTVTIGTDGEAKTLALTLKDSTVKAGTYTKVMVDAKGIVTAATALVENDLPNISQGKVTGLEMALSGINDKISKMDTAYKEADKTEKEAREALAGRITTAEGKINTLQATKIGATGDVTATSVSVNAGQEVNLNVTLKDNVVTAGTATKVTYNSKGLVTGKESLLASDIPTLTLAKISDKGTAAAKNAALSGAGNVLLIGEDGKISNDVLPKLAISDTFIVKEKQELTSLTAEVGDIAIVTTENRTYILTDPNVTTFSGETKVGNWVPLATPTDKVISVNGLTGAVELNTDNVPEGGHKYYTEELATANFNVNWDKKTTDNLTQGNTKLFVTPEEKANWADKYTKNEVNEKVNTLEGKITKNKNNITKLEKAFVQKVIFMGGGATRTASLSVKGYPVSQVFDAKGDMILCDINLGADNTITVKGASGECFMFVQEVKPILE